MNERYGTCTFPMWAEGERPTHVFCNMKTEVGKPYCAHHMAATRVNHQPPAEISEGRAEP